jgi:hypothetical protein
MLQTVTLFYIHCAQGAVQWRPQGAVAIPRRFQFLNIRQIKIWFDTLQARSAIRDLDPTNDLKILRIRSKKNEVLVAPGKQNIHTKHLCI